MGTLSASYPNSVSVEAALDRANRAELEIIQIKARLDALEYEDIKINSFTAVPSLCELGSNNTITLAWGVNKTPTSQTINGTTVSGSSTSYEGVTSNITYTLGVGDGQTTDSKSVSVSFANQIYWGADSDLNNITSLTKTLSNTKTRTINVTAVTGEYIIYALPTRLGQVTFYVEGFEGGFEPPVEKALTNESGYRENYYVYRSTNANLGATTVEVKGG